MSASPETEYLTIKEVADALNVSVQAVYQRLDKDFKPYLKVVDGKKRLDKSALGLNDKVDSSSGLTSEFKEILKLLERQLEEKDRQLAVKDRQISELTATVKTQAESINADRQNQLAGTLIEGRQIIEGSADPSVPDDTPPKKKRFFARVFGKD